MKLKFSFCFLILLTYSTQAQRLWQEVDSVVYQLYSKSKWSELTTYGLDASEAGFDYYRLNLRTGMAFYYTKNWQEAEFWFQKAIKNGDTLNIAKEFLYWTFLNTGKEVEASEVHKDLPPSVKKRIPYQPRQLLSSIYVEGGYKVSNRADSVKPFQYFSIGLNHKFSPQFSLYHAYSFMSQSFYWGNYTQQQYYFSPTVSLKNGIKVNAGLNVFGYSSQHDYASANRTYRDSTIINAGQNRRVTIFEATAKTTYRGSLGLNAYYGSIGVSKNWGLAQVGVQFSLYSDKSNLVTTRIIDSATMTTTFLNGTKQGMVGSAFQNGKDSTGTSNYLQKQLGLTASYSFLLSSQYSLTVGAEVQYVMGNLNALKLIPSFNLALGPKFGLSGLFLQKGYYPLGVSNGGLVINNYDNYRSRLSLTGKIQVLPPLSIFVTGQWENIDTNFGGHNYSLAGGFAGLNWKF